MSVASAFTTVVPIAVAFIVAQSCAVAWRWALELSEWEQQLLELTELIAADIILTDPATKLWARRNMAAVVGGLVSSKRALSEDLLCVLVAIVDATPPCWAFAKTTPMLATKKLMSVFA